MGRSSTGICTTGGAYRISVSDFAKWDVFEVGNSVEGVLGWTDGSQISFSSQFDEVDWWIDLKYSLTDHTGEKHSMNYRILGLHTL